MSERRSLIRLRFPAVSHQSANVFRDEFGFIHSVTILQSVDERIVKLEAGEKISKSEASENISHKTTPNDNTSDWLDKNRSVIQCPAIQISLLSPFCFFQLVKAHKLFLAMGSSVIEGLLFGGMAQANAQHQSSTMHSTQYCKPVRQCLAQGMYKSTVNLIRSVFQQLIWTA